MEIHSFYAPTNFASTWAKFKERIENHNKDGRKKKETTSNVIVELIEEYVKKMEKQPKPTEQVIADAQTASNQAEKANDDAVQASTTAQTEV